MKTGMVVKKANLCSHVSFLRRREEGKGEGRTVSWQIVVNWSGGCWPEKVVVRVHWQVQVWRVSRRGEWEFRTEGRMRERRERKVVRREVVRVVMVAESWFQFLSSVAASSV